MIMNLVRTHRFKRICEFAFNLLTLAVFAAVMWRWSGPWISSLAARSSEVGALLRPVAGSWAGHRAWLFVVVREGCQFCQKDEDFHRDLLRVAKGQFQTTLVIDSAAAQSQADAATRYSRKHGLLPTESKILDTSQWGVKGTPTILLVSTEGRVFGSWLGALGPDDRKQVMSQVVTGMASSLKSEVHSVQDFALSEFSRGHLLVDTRSRDAYSAGHIKNALNIPSEELSVRSPVELTEGERLAIYCSEGTDRKGHDGAKCVNDYLNLAHFSSIYPYMVSGPMDVTQTESNPSKEIR